MLWDGCVAHGALGLSYRGFSGHGSLAAGGSSVLEDPDQKAHLGKPAWPQVSSRARQGLGSLRDWPGVAWPR